MDITSHELKTMKVKQLRRLIREAITEVLAEAPDPIAYSTDSPSKTAAKDKLKKTPKFTSLKAPDKDALLKGIDKDNDGGVINLEEDDLKEMAMGNKLSDENMDLSQFANQKLSGVSLSDILTYIKDNPGATEKQIADEFKFARQQPINALMKALRDKEIVTRLDKSGEVIVPKAPGEEEEEEEVDGVEGIFLGKYKDPVSQHFDGVPNADGSEDFTDEEEPKDIEKTEPIRPTTAKSKAAEFTTDDRNSRLIQKIINLYSTSKTRVREVSDKEGGDLSSRDVSIAAKKSKESAEGQLPELIKQLADKIKAEEPEVQRAILELLGKRFASVNYTSLTKRVAREVGIDIKEPMASKEEPETEEEAEDTIDEAFDAEYTKRKLQFYAGIIK